MNKTKKMMAGVAASVMAISVTGCGNQDLPPEPTDVDCDDWEWDDDSGTYYCDDNRSPHFGYFWFAGRMFKNKSNLKNFSKYKSYSKSYKSGIGSGSKGGFGG
ncbi:hypothetical protein [Rossellomorea vietnamensis]|uniref:hypothetical protein n=1 Tax=Rossellomorea vietnamensis TaxID=218284 RepID=UPI003D2851A6